MLKGLFMVKRNWVIPLIWALFVFLMNQTADAETYTIAHLDGGSPHLSDNGELAYDAGSDGDIFLYNSATGSISQVTDYNSQDYSNGIIVNAVGDIVWTREIGSTDQLFLYDRSTSPPEIKQITDVSSDIFSPHLNDSGDIVYATRPSDGSDMEVFLYVRSTGETRRLTDNMEYDGAPMIGGNGDVVWTHNDGDDEVYLYKRSSAQTIILTNNDYQDNYVDAVNARGDVVWYARMPESNEEIFYYDNGANTVVQIVNVGCDDMFPDINDAGDIVWNMSCPGVNGREINQEN